MKTIIQIENIDGVTWRFSDEQKFISWAKGIHDENENADEDSGIPEPQTLDQCLEYIDRYCGNLMLSHHLS